MESSFEEPIISTPRLAPIERPGTGEAWQMVAGQLRMEMRRVDYETWVAPLQPLGFYDGVYRLGAHNSYALDWVESRLRNRISGLLESLLNQPVQLKFALIQGKGDQPPAIDLQAPVPSSEQGSKPREVSQPGAEPVEQVEQNPPAKKKKIEPEPGEGGSPRKIQLQRAYGTARARVVQPERGMFITNYLFSAWLPLLGHSAFAAVLAARSLCYWNPMTGEMRNVIETDMSELARRANISVRTIKDVLNDDLIKRYFLRYKVRRLMTPNGVRTAGILLQVRMDDPLTPEDQDRNNLPEEEHWYTIDLGEGEEAE